MERLLLSDTPWPFNRYLCWGGNYVLKGRQNYIFMLPNIGGFSLAFGPVFIFLTKATIVSECLHGEKGHSISCRLVPFHIFFDSSLSACIWQSKSVDRTFSVSKHKFFHSDALDIFEKMLSTCHSFPSDSNGKALLNEPTFLPQHRFIHSALINNINRWNLSASLDMAF